MTSRPYHFGTVVEDIDESVATYSKALGIRFCSTRRVRMGVIRAGEPCEVDLLVTYSRDAEPYLELIQELEGRTWARNEFCMDHVGYWTSDMTADIDRLERAGFTNAVKGLSTDSSPGPSFAYLQSPGGLWVELVATAGRDSFEKWLATSHIPGGHVEF